MASKILLVLGGGRNIGLSVAKRFHQNGYKVAVVSRTSSSDYDGTADLVIKEDLATGESGIQSIFKQVREKLGEPGVVVYNASAFKFAPKDDPLAQPFSEVQPTLVVNLESAYYAAQEAVKSFKALPGESKKTFIYTGNILNISPLPGLLAPALGKSAAAALIANAAVAYGEKGYHFYYADERTATGAAVFSAIDGEAAAEDYWKLANAEKQGPWEYTFVKGKGYVDFKGQ